MFALLAQLVEYFHGTERVGGSNPPEGSKRTAPINNGWSSASVLFVTPIWSVCSASIALLLAKGIELIGWSVSAVFGSGNQSMSGATGTAALTLSRLKRHGFVVGSVRISILLRQPERVTRLGLLSISAALVRDADTESTLRRSISIMWVTIKSSTWGQTI